MATANVIPRLPPAHFFEVGKLSLFQATHTLSVRLTNSLSGGILSEEDKKGYEKSLINNCTSLTWSTT